jgi:diguanylate cyclase (GGDEF)-like protein/PAS domain S-box-containing protein
MTGATPGAPRILVVDDDATSRGIARAALEAAGCVVSEAVDGLEALAVFDRATPDLVLLDVEMPGLDGLAVCRELRRRPAARYVPVVMVTGLDDLDSIEAAFAAGATDFIAKPVNWALLRHRVRYTLRAAEAMRDVGRSEEKFRLITESTSDFIALLDREGQRLYSSPSYRTVFGEAQLAGTDSFREIHPDDREQIRELFRATVQTGVGREGRYRWVLPDGSVRYLESRGSVIRDEAGEVARVVVLSRDVTERTRQEAKIVRLSRIGAVLSGINSAIVRIRERALLLQEACRIAVEQGHFVFAWVGLLDGDTRDIVPVASQGDGQGFLEVGRFSARDELGPSLSARVFSSLRPVVSNDIAADTQLRHGKEALARGFRSVVGLPLVVEGRAAGIMVLYSSVPGFFDAEEMRLLEDLAGDISFGLDHIEKEKAVHHLAYYDTLTGLPNRRLFQETLATLTETWRGAGKLAVVIVDVRGFHVVNDNLGRHAGDALLKAVAQRVRNNLSSADTLGRIGGDQFGLILHDVPHEATLGTLLERVFGVLRSPFHIDGESVRLSIKAGGALFPSATDGSTADELLINAESALKKAKASPEPYHFYTPHLNAAIANRVALEIALERALEAGQFTLLYQPKIDMRSGIATGLEALLYWNEPGRGLTSPARFIPVLEETGMILAVGRWVIGQAMADLRTLRARGHEATRIAVNVSPLQFRQKDFPGYLAAAMGGPADGLDIEITESVMMEDIEACVQVLWRLREMGIEVALDDFGTGYSSLSYVARLPATALKIDKSFVSGPGANPGRRAIVSSVVSLAHALGMKVVAEGVETQAQADMLRELRCDEMQGYLFGRPAPLADVCQLLEVPVAP